MRNSNDWLSDYVTYARDGFCPDKFHFWTGVSVLAAALERKVWVCRDSFNLYPNLYLLLIGRPGVGKSSAANVGVNEFLRKLKFGELDSLNFLAVQNSEASFIEQAANWREFQVAGQTHTHASSYFYASEASNSLKEMVGGGSVTSALTDFYDCPAHWKKKLVSKQIEIKNGCCNLLACSTFSYLKKLVPKDEAEGGFASRLLYIIQEEMYVRSPGWKQLGRNFPLRDKLFADLERIHAMTGPFSPDADFIAAYEAWFPEQDRQTQSMKSERLQHFMARKHTNLLKLAMVCSVSESGDMRLKLKHWERAQEMMAEVEMTLPGVVTRTIDKESAKGVTYLVLKIVEDAGGECSRQQLYDTLAREGVSTSTLEFHLKGLLVGRSIVCQTNGSEIRYKLFANPQDYL